MLISSAASLEVPEHSNRTDDGQPSRKPIANSTCVLGVPNATNHISVAKRPGQNLELCRAIHDALRPRGGFARMLTVWFIIQLTHHMMGERPSTVLYRML